MTSPAGLPFPVWVEGGNRTPHYGSWGHGFLDGRQPLSITLSITWGCHSVAQLCLTLWDTVVCSTPASSVLRDLPEFAQIHVHWVGDATRTISPSAWGCHGKKSSRIPSFWRLIVLDFCGLVSRLLTTLAIPLLMILWDCPKSPIVPGASCLIMLPKESLGLLAHVQWSRSAHQVAMMQSAAFTAGRQARSPGG